MCNLCNISYTSYHVRLVKLKHKSLEYQRFEFDLINVFKIINGVAEQILLYTYTIFCIIFRTLSFKLLIKRQQ